LQFRFALSAYERSRAWREHGFPIRLCSGGPVGRNGDGASLRGIDSYGEETETLDLNERGGAVGYIEHSFHDFSGAAASFIRKLRHKKILSPLLKPIL
jgi:hypothetical protein